MFKIYQLVRIACFIALPLFFRLKELAPQPVKNMLSAFIASVIITEIFQYFLRSSQIRSFLSSLPFLAVLAFIYPYLSDIGYFEETDRLVIYLSIGLSLIYFLDRKYLYTRISG